MEKKSLKMFERQLKAAEKAASLAESAYEADWARSHQPDQKINSEYWRRQLDKRCRKLTEKQNAVNALWREIAAVLG